MIFDSNYDCDWLAGANARCRRRHRRRRYRHVRPVAPHPSSCPVLLDGPNLFSHLTCAQDQSGKLQNNKIIRIATGSHKTTATLSPLYAENRSTIMYEIFNFRKDTFGD